jgi:hypothetical protein
MMTIRKCLSCRNAVIIAITLAVVTFLLGITNYIAHVDLIANIMLDYAWLAIPYRWILAALVIFVAAVSLWNCPKNPN